MLLSAKSVATKKMAIKQSTCSGAKGSPSTRYGWLSILCGKVAYTTKSIFIGAPHQVRIRLACLKTGWLARCLKNSCLLASLSVFLNSPHSLACSFVDVDSRFLLQNL